jgi:hypothetical protein
MLIGYFCEPRRLGLANETPFWLNLKRGPTMMRLNLTLDSDLDGRSPRKHISERRISMAESEWAKGMAQELKAGKARKAEGDGKLLKEQTTRKGFAFKLWTDAKNFHRLAI